MANRSLVICLAIISFSNCVRGQSNVSPGLVEVVVNMEPTKALPINSSLTLKTDVKDNNGRDEFKLTGSSQKIEFPFPGNKSLLLVEYELDDLPNNYDFDEISLEYPITQIGKTNTVTLSPYPTNSNTGTIIRELFKQNVNSSTPIKTLYQRLQLSRHCFEKRSQGAVMNWEELHDYHVQSCYIYLSTVLELVKRDFLAIPDDVEKKVSWLREAINIKPDRVNGSVKVKNARYLITLIEGLEAQRFTKLWNYATKESKYDQRYKLLKGMLERFRSYPTEDARRQIVNNSKITESEMLRSMSQALYNSVRVQGIRIERLNSEVDWMIQELGRILPSLNENEATLIQRDLSVLPTLKS